MPYFKNKKILFIHIPKTGGTSLETYLSRNEEMLIYHNKTSKILYNFDEINGISLQHLTYKDILKNKEKFKLNFNNIKIISIVRNPYERIISDLIFFKIINLNTHPNKVYKRMKNYIFSPNEKFDNHNLQQYCFLINNNNEIEKKIKIFKCENLNNELINYGFKDFDLALTFKQESDIIQINDIEKIKKERKEKYMKLLNKNSIKLINRIYEKDFILFNYKML